MEMEQPKYQENAIKITTSKTVKDLRLSVEVVFFIVVIVIDTKKPEK